MSHTNYTAKNCSEGAEANLAQAFKGAGGLSNGGVSGTPPPTPSPTGAELLSGVLTDVCG